VSENFLDLDHCLGAARALHGDVCAGIAIGTRMTIAGLRAIGIEDPTGEDRKKLMVFVEIDRCATDAIMAITGCRPGKRTMKIYDHGKMAATFLNLETGSAVRVTVKETENGPQGTAGDPYLALPDEELLSIEAVSVDVPPQDMPGKPIKVVRCAACGERAMDMREEVVDGRTLCRPCARGIRFYSPAQREKA
jgi:formylmethanofuran dehydrogenase subunit E